MKKTSLPTLRVIDHVGNFGGGITYVMHLLLNLQTDWNVELHAQPFSLQRYRNSANQQNICFHKNLPLSLIPILSEQSPLVSRVLAAAGLAHHSWTYTVRNEIEHHTAIHFFPWLHRHNLELFTGRGIGVFHDALFFQMPDLIGQARVDLERKNLATWFEKLDLIVTTSNHTKRKLLALTNDYQESKIQVIPVADTNELPSADASTVKKYGKYLLMSANVSPHKNHRILIQALKHCLGDWNLVLTGDGTNFINNSPLYSYARELGIANRVHGLGYVPVDLLGALVKHADAVVMPTLGEGGGSFPVSEAVTAGTPVICSSIDVIIEQTERMRAKVHFFNPIEVNDLINKLNTFHLNRAEHHRLAQEQRHNLRVRTWKDVASDFQNLFHSKYQSTG